MITFENEFNSDIEVNPQKALMPTLIDEYEKVIVKTLITSFGLDLFIKDHHGGDVDTINNVRKIGADPEMEYKNKINESNYENRGDYSHKDYNSDQRFSSKKSEARKQWQETGKNINDEYQGGNIGFYGHTKSISPEKKAELDHIVETKAIHDDRGRCLSGLSGVDLANDPSNLAWTNKSLNASMGSWAKEVNKRYREQYGCDAPIDMVDMRAYLKAHENDFDEKTKKRMLKKYDEARKEYEQKINKAYYSFDSNSFSSIDEFKKSCLQFKNSQFFKDTKNAVYTRGLQMAVRQALGFALSEIYFEVRVEFKNQDNSNSFDLKDFFKKIIEGIKRGFSKVIKDYKQLLSSFADGALAGALSAISTTLINIFTTTLKNTGRIIRQSWASIVEALKVLFFNPDNLRLGDRIKAVLKIIATGATVVFGYYLNSILENSGIGAVPLVGSILSEVISGLVTGIISCTLLYFIDHNQSFNKIFELLNGPSIEESKEFYQEQAQKFEEYACKLEKIDVNKFKKEVDFYRDVSSNLSRIKDSAKFNEYLKKLLEEMNSKLPWIGDFDEFMSNKNNRLTFE